MMLAHYWKILKDTEKRVEHSLRLQVLAEGPTQGGFVDKKGLIHGKHAIYCATTAIAAYCNSDSVYYKEHRVYQMINLALDYVIRVQHDNGLFDLISCNFFSAPDTAFCIKRLLPCLKYLEKQRETQEEEHIYQTIKGIVRKGAEGLKIGGFHTPNHRWAIASNLMECGKYFDDEEMILCANQYLNEGIDCNEDGEFAEKSSGNYNRINNDAMITLGDITGEERFYEYAVKNLEMMLTYIEPNGSIFTANSTRQDNGTLVFPKDYYMEYLDMGYRRNIPEYLDMANYIFKIIEEKGITAPDHLIHMMNRPELKMLEHEGIRNVLDFSRLYQESGILRVRHGEYSYTLMAQKSGFLHFSNQTIHMEMKLGGSFFEHRGFIPESLEKTDKGHCLEQVMKGWYYLPFKEKPATSDWWKMDNESRETFAGPQMKLKVQVEEEQDGINVHIQASGVEGAPFRIEIAVSGADLLWNEQFTVQAAPGNSMILKQGNVVFSNSSDSLEIGPGFGTHLFTNGKFGSEEQSKYAFTLYLTEYTEFDKVIKIRSGKKVV